MADFALSTTRLTVDVRRPLNVFGDLRYKVDKYDASDVLLSFGILEAGAVVNCIRKHLIGTNDLEQVTLLKRSFTESFTMIGVGGAIIAQIAFTGLNLDQNNETHWTVCAAFVASLTDGCLSVFYSCTMQLVLSGVHGPEEILYWLTKPKLTYEARPTRPKDTREHSREFSNPNWQTERLLSLNAALMLVAPSELLSCSLASFLAVLGIYLGFLYSRNLGGVRGEDSALRFLSST